MNNLKIIFSSLLLLIIGYSSALSDITQSAPTNIMQQIAQSTSFSATNQNTPEIANQIQATTTAIVDQKSLIAAVRADAAALGLKVNNEALGTTGNNDQEDEPDGEDKYAGRTDLEPNIDTVVYKSGLLNLEQDKSGNYNTTDGIFVTGEQQAQMNIYIDFKRKVFWGDVESKIKLKTQPASDPQHINNLNGGSATITQLPINKQLNYTVKNDGSIMAVGSEPYGWDKDNNINSILNTNGDLQSWTEYPDLRDGDVEQNIKNISHGTGGDGNVLVGALYKTATSTTPGEGTISFEASIGAANDTDTAFANNVIRYSADVVLVGEKYEGEKRKNTENTRE